MILRLTPTTVALAGETAAEWQWLETQVRAGRWTTGALADAVRLRRVALELGVPLRVDGLAPRWRRRADRDAGEFAPARTSSRRPSG